MPDEDKDQNLNSALDLWQEAVDKAGVDLEKIVRSSIEQLSRYSEELEKSLALQLKKVTEQTSSMVDNNLEELTAKKEDLTERLAEFEREEADKMLRGAQEAREKIYAQVDKTKQELHAKLNDTLKTLHRLAEGPESRFNTYTVKNRESLAEMATGAKDRIVGERTKFESDLHKKSTELEQQLEKVMAGTKIKIDERLQEYEEGFDKKIGRVLSQLDDMLEVTTEAADQATTQGIADLERCEHENEDFLRTQVEQWQSSLEAMKRNFQEELESAREETLSSHSRRLAYNVSEAKLSINQVSSDALARITGNHRMYYSSLKRLERQYLEQVSKLFNRLESIVSEDHDFGASTSVQSIDEVREKLRSQLKLRGNEVVKTYKRQVEQLEGDFARASATSYERIDSIRLQTIESLEKQVRIIRSELDRIEKMFKAELSQASIEIPEIEERGRVAVMSVSAYLSSALNLETD